MKRQTVSEFSLAITGEAGGPVNRTPSPSGDEWQRMNLECTDIGVALLFSVAKLSQYFHDFPDYIPLNTASAKDGKFLADYGLRRDTSGVWRMSGNMEDFLDALIKKRISMHPRWLVADALAAMGIRHTSEAHDKVADLLTWGDQTFLPRMITRMSGLVPRHTLYSALSHGNKMATYFEVPATQDFASKMVDTIDRLGIDVDGRSMPGVYPALIRLAYDGDNRFIEELLNWGASPDIQYGDQRADFIAALNGNVTTLSLICDAKSDVNGIDHIGENLLNAVLHRLNGPDNSLVPPMVEYLLEKGVDPNHPDRYGQTAVEAVEQRAELHREMNKDKPWLLEAIEKTKAIIDAHLQPGLKA